MEERKEEKILGRASVNGVGGVEEGGEKGR